MSRGDGTFGRELASARADQPIMCESCDGCGRSPTVTLIDGRHVCTWSEAWRHECEARRLLQLPSLELRRQYLDAVGKRRGRKAENALRDTAMAIWQATRQAA